MKFLAAFFSLLILLLIILVCVKSKETIESELYSHFRKTRIDFYSGQIDYDKIMTENNMFTAELIYYLKTKPETIEYGFSELTGNGLTVNASTDKNFRIYSWLINWGGNDPEVFNIYQYRLKNNHGVWSDTDNNNAGGYVIDIFQCKFDNGDQYYFPYLRSPQSDSPRVEEITNLIVTSDGTFKDNGLFLTDSSKLKGSLVIAYLPSSIIKGIDCKISFDERTKTFTVPVIERKTLYCTSKYKKYNYNGEYFTD